MKNLEINLMNEFKEVNYEITDKLTELLKTFCNYENSIRINKQINEKYIESEILTEYNFEKQKIKIEYYRHYKYSLMNFKDSFEYSNILTISGENENIVEFKNNLFIILNK